MVVIADCADDDGTNAWPSHETIASRSATNRRTVQREIKGLVSLGELQVEEHMGGPLERDDRYRTHRYSIPLTHWLMAEGDAARGGLATPDRGGLTPPLRGGLQDIQGRSTVPVRGGLTPPDLSFDSSLEPSFTKTARKTAAPDTFPITPSMRSWAKGNGGEALDLDRETQQFLDYHAARGTKFVKWDRAWQTWIRNQVKWNAERGTPDGDEHFFIDASGNRIAL
jgi:hypothetical protein